MKIQAVTTDAQALEIQAAALQSTEVRGISSLLLRAGISITAAQSITSVDAKLLPLNLPIERRIAIKSILSRFGLMQNQA